MKNLTKIFMAFVAVMLVSCIADTTTEPTVELGKVKTTIDLSFEGVKTHLGDKVEVEEGKFQYPLLWSAGDQIAVNGIASEPLAEEFDGKAGASFEIESETELTYPRSIVYPAPAEGETGVTFQAVQAYEAGNIADGVAPLYGYAAEAGDVITLQHLTGVLRFAVKGEATLASITVKAENGAIAGSYDIDCATGALTAQEGKTSDQITMSFGDGLALSTDEATPIYITIPAGEYGAIITRLVATDGKTMVVKFPSQIKAIAAGKVREFAEFTFVENSVEAEDDGVFEIYTYEDLKRFTKIAATFYPRTEAKLMEDIAIPAEETWTPIEGFNHTFNGNGKSISGLTAPLFGTTAAKIKDLSLTNVAIESANETMVGAIARQMVDGALTGCSASGTIAYTKNENVVGRVAGLVGLMDGCTFTENTNNINISVSLAVDSSWAGWGNS